MRRFTLLAAFIWLAGCSSGPSDEEKTVGQTSHLQADAQAAFEQDLKGAYEDYDTCVSESHCAGTAERADFDDEGGVRTTSLRIRGIFDNINICDALTPLAGLEHAYYFVGASITGAAVVGGQGGVDVVWDLWNQQAATFGYAGGGLMSLVGGEAAVYSGYGFGNKSDVIDAWSGQFRTGSLSVGLPVLNLSAGASGFTSPDGSVIGGAVSASIGLNWIPTPVSGSFVVGEWVPFNAGTSALRSSLWFASNTEEQTANGSKYLQFSGGRALATSILQTTGSATAAAQAVALAIVKSQGVSISQLCGVAAPAPAAAVAAPAAPAAPARAPAGPCDGKNEAECRGLTACQWTDGDPNDDTRTDNGGCIERPAPSPEARSCYSISDADTCTATSGCRWYLDLNDDTLTTAFCVAQDDARR